MNENVSEEKQVDETKQSKEAVFNLVKILFFIIMLFVICLLYYKVYRHEQSLSKLQSYTICTVNLQRLTNEIPQRMSLDPTKTEADLDKVNVKVSETLNQGIEGCSIIVLQGAVFGSRSLIDVTDKVIDTAFTD